MPSPVTFRYEFASTYSYLSAMQAAIRPDIKARLRTNVEQAIDAGLFGGASFTVDGELFWGDDRFKDALDWATRPHIKD